MASAPSKRASASAPRSIGQHRAGDAHTGQLDGTARAGQTGLGPIEAFVRRGVGASAAMDLGDLSPQVGPHLRALLEIDRGPQVVHRGLVLGQHLERRAERGQHFGAARSVRRGCCRAGRSRPRSSGWPRGSDTGFGRDRRRRTGTAPRARDRRHGRSAAPAAPVGRRRLRRSCPRARHPRCGAATSASPKAGWRRPFPGPADGGSARSRWSRGRRRERAIRA